MPLFNADTPARKLAIVNGFNRRIKAPYVHTQVSTLGGEERASVMLTGSLDPKGKWTNGILHNSRYFMVRIDRIGTVEMFSLGMGMRKQKMRTFKATSLGSVVIKINQWIRKVS